MPDPGSFALFFVAALILAITPGPGIFYVAARTLAGGRDEGIASSLGTGIGGAVHVLAGALGVSAVVLASAELFAVLKFVGAAYLAFIGWRTVQAARGGRVAPDKDAGSEPPLGVGRAFREGVLVEALNPKTAAFFLAFIPQFVDPQGSVALQFMGLGMIAVTLNTLADVVVAFAASGLRAGASTRPHLIRRLRMASGGAMMLLGLGLALARRPA